MEWAWNLGGSGGIALRDLVEFWDRLSGEVLVWAAIAAVLLLIAAYAIGRLRAPPAQHEPTASDLMSKFREMHSRGELSDEEFRTIKTTLAARLEHELKDNGEKG